MHAIDRHYVLWTAVRIIVERLLSRGPMRGWFGAQPAPKDCGNLNARSASVLSTPWSDFHQISAGKTAVVRSLMS